MESFQRFAGWTAVQNGGPCFHPRENLRQEVVTSNTALVCKSTAITLFVFCVHVCILGNRRTQILEPASSSINIITLPLPTDRVKHNSPSPRIVLSTKRLFGGVAEVEVCPADLVTKFSLPPLSTSLIRLEKNFVNSSRLLTFRIQNAFHCLLFHPHLNFCHFKTKCGGAKFLPKVLRLVKYDRDRS
jgi:hypothetical protein